VSRDVHYVAASDTFSGTENMQQELESHGLELAASDRIRVNGRAVMLMEVLDRSKTRKIYSLYATGDAGTQTVYMTWHPPGDDLAVGDCYWKLLKARLIASEGQRATKAAPPPAAAGGDQDFASSLRLSQQADNDKSLVTDFTKAAHEGKVDAMLGMMAPSVRRAQGDETVRAILRDIVPFFAKFVKVHTYETVTHAAMPDGRSGTWHYTYIVDDTDKPKPFRIAVIEEDGALRVVFVEVGKCIQGRHPFCN
jgi:hypothetical protein